MEQREIKFRGMELDRSNGWVIGSLVSAKTPFIVKPDETDRITFVDFATVGQFTGLLDKNGKEIYEGDAFHCIYRSDGHTDHWCYVAWNEEQTRFGLRWVGARCRQDQVFQTLRDVMRYAMIGNIYENPELLEDK